MEQIEKQYKIKKFFKLLYRGITEEEYIRVFQANNKDYSNVKYFNDIDELVSFSASNKVLYNNTYFTLATTDGKGGSTEHLMYRYFLGFDFDKKDQVEGFNHIDILNKFKSLKIHYNCLIDSGNGYHVYICIERTNDLQKVKEVQEVLCNKLGADKNAIKTTQILRIPYTFNIKNNGHKQVNIIHMEDRHKIKPYDIDFLYQKNCNVKHKEEAKEQTTITLNNTNVPACIKDVLTNGTKEGDRYTDLQRIVVLLRQRNKSIEEIKKVCREWATKSSFDDNLDYRIDNIYNNLSYISLECKECKHKQECYSSIVSNFEYDKDDKLINFNSRELCKLALNNQKKGAKKVMKSNELLVYSILKLHNDGLTREEITKELTYKSKKKKIERVAISERTLKGVLKSMEDNKFVEVKTLERGKKLYIANSSNNGNFVVSYSATFECIKGNISEEEYMLYCYMRYLHHKEQEQGIAVLKGNLFQCNQVRLAEYFNVTQQRISKMIDNLLEEKLLSIWYRQVSKNNGYEYNVYRLNY